ncbi:MAG: hypothetical protein ABJC26_02740 [Gemmatimonadaceae bacterium]
MIISSSAFILFVARASLASVPFTQPLPNQSPADTILAGNTALNHTAPFIGADTTEVYAIRDGKRQLISTDVQVTSRITNGFLVVFTGQSTLGKSIDSVSMAAGTLAPLRHVEILPKHSAAFIFGDSQLTGIVNDSTGTHNVNIALRANVLDFSIISAATNCLPLSTGYAAVILTYDVARRAEVAVGFAVAAREKIRWHDHDVETWKTITDLGTHKITRWTDVASRRDVRWEINTSQMHIEGVLK